MRTRLPAIVAIGVVVAFCFGAQTYEGIGTERHDQDANRATSTAKDAGTTRRGGDTATHRRTRIRGTCQSMTDTA